MAVTGDSSSARRFLTVPEVAAELNVSQRMVRRLIADSRLPATRFGVHVRVGVDELEAFIAQCRSSAR